LMIAIVLANFDLKLENNFKHLKLIIKWQQ
jgi:hypothetical protein